MLKECKIDKVSVEDLSVVMDCFDVEGSGMCALRNLFAILNTWAKAKC